MFSFSILIYVIMALCHCNNQWILCHCDGFSVVVEVSGFDAICVAFGGFGGHRTKFGTFLGV